MTNLPVKVSLYSMGTWHVCGKLLRIALGCERTRAGGGTVSSFGDAMDGEEWWDDDSGLIKSLNKEAGPENYECFPW